jgi:hypothetical protein
MEGSGGSPGRGTKAIEIWTRNRERIDDLAALPATTAPEVVVKDERSKEVRIWALETAVWGSRFIARLAKILSLLGRGGRYPKPLK